MSVHKPTTLRRYMHYRKKDDLIVMKYGAEWCGPCKAITPVLQKLAKEHSHVYFVDVDIDNDEIIDHEDLSNVKKIPHVKFFVNGKLEQEFVGKDDDKLHRYVKRYSEVKLKEVRPVENLDIPKEKDELSDHELSDYNHDQDSEHDLSDHELSDELSEHNHVDQYSKDELSDKEILDHNIDDTNTTGYNKYLKNYHECINPVLTDDNEEYIDELIEEIVEIIFSDNSTNLNSDTN